MRTKQGRLLLSVNLREIKEELRKIRLMEESALKACGFKAASDSPMEEAQADLLTKLLISHRLRPIEIAEQLLKELETIVTKKEGEIE